MDPRRMCMKVFRLEFRQLACDIEELVFMEPDSGSCCASAAVPPGGEMQIESRGLDDQRVLEISYDEENQQQLCSESFLQSSQRSWNTTQTIMGQTRNRTYLLCPVCKKTQWSLPVHLRRSCMKNSPGVDIERTVDAAKREANELLRQDNVWMSKELQDGGNVAVENVGRFMYYMEPKRPSLLFVRQHEKTREYSNKLSEAGLCKQTVQFYVKSVKSQTRNRTHLLCPVCKKTQWSLPVHLRRSCMKNSPGVDIERTVDAAKREANELLCQDHVWEYDLIRKILDNPDPVSRSCRMEGMLWSTSPPKDPAPAIAAIQPAACSPSAGPAQAESEAGSESSRELYHCPTTVKTTSLRKRTSKSGLYGKHSIDHPLQMSIAKYLQVENVGRFMYYMDPKRPSLLFVRQHEKTREYSNKLSEAGLCKQMVQFYVKSVKSSMLGAPASALKTVLHKDSNNYVLFLSNLQASASKQVIEWVQRKRVPEHGGHVVVGVKEHNICNTGGHLYSLPGGGDGKILDWFDLYFTEVRPVMLGEKRKHMEDETDESEERFISSTGSSIYNASNDLERLHRKYQMPKVTSQMARRSFETATKKMTDTEKSMVADYFTHSSATAENVVTASLLLKRLLSGLDSSEERGVCTGSGCSQLEDQAPHHLLVKSYTLMVDGAAPKRSVRASLTGVHERCCYDRWCSYQLQLHMQHVLEHFGRRLPSEDRVRSRDGLQTFQMQPLFSGRGSHLGGA
ncbi:hypothetical protein AOLI_G00046210 [Acnodon oligacanthus]